jgi:hypothetical protein
MLPSPILRAPGVVESQPPNSAQQSQDAQDAQGVWRIVRGLHELGRYKSEDTARSRWRTLRELVVGHGAMLIRPDGTVAAE